MVIINMINDNGGGGNSFQDVGIQPLNISSSHNRSIH